MDTLMTAPDTRRIPLAALADPDICPAGTRHEVSGPYGPPGMLRHDGPLPAADCEGFQAHWSRCYSRWAIDGHPQPAIPPLAPCGLVQGPQIQRHDPAVDVPPVRALYAACTDREPHVRQRPDGLPCPTCGTPWDLPSCHGPAQHGQPDGPYVAASLAPVAEAQESDRRRTWRLAVVAALLSLLLAALAWTAAQPPAGRSPAPQPTPAPGPALDFRYQPWRSL